MPHGETNSSTSWIYSRLQTMIRCHVDTAGETAEHDEFTGIFLEPWEWKDKISVLT